MKTKEEQIYYIYDKVANKKLTFWCIVNWIDKMIYDFYYVWFTGFWNSWKMIFQRKWWLTNWDKSYIQILTETFKKRKIKIIWHPVYIGTILTFANFDEWLQPNDIINEWWDLRRPLEDQHEKTIEYIYNLLKTKQLWQI